MKNKPPYIKLVFSAKNKLQTKEENIHQAQLSLFPENNPHSIVYVTPGKLGESEFMDVFDKIHPRTILDLRMAPRFDIGMLNRKKVFDFFLNEKMDYHDLHVWKDFENSSHTHYRSLLAWINNFMQVNIKDDELKGPLLILIDKQCQDDENFLTITHDLKKEGKTQKEWDVYSLN